MASHDPVTAMAAPMLPVSVRKNRNVKPTSVLAGILDCLRRIANSGINCEPRSDALLLLLLSLLRLARSANCYLRSSLPEEIAARFRNEEHLRKHALIAGGFCDSTSVPCSTRAEAERWFDVLTRDNPYCIVKIEGNTLIRFTAQSQSMKATGPARFQKSKRAVLDAIDDLLGVERGATAENARRAA
jgi:hypothetical protein